MELFDFREGELLFDCCSICEEDDRVAGAGVSFDANAIERLIDCVAE